LLAAAAALFGTGLGLRAAGPGSPQIRVVSGEVLLGGAVAGLGSRLAAGSVLELTGRSSAATLRSVEAESVVLTGPARLTYLGSGSLGHVYSLQFGTAFVRLSRMDRRIAIRTPWGQCRSEGGVFEVYVSPRARGTASATPRFTRLSVADGEGFLTPFGDSGRALFVPSGVRAEVREGAKRIVVEGFRRSGEWQRFLGRRPGLGDEHCPLAEIPSGAWMPRRPGSRGPTPGSRSGVVMRYCRTLGLGVLHDAEAGAWLYDAARDRWKRSRSKPPDGDGAGASKRPDPAADGVTAQSGRSGALLFYGTVAGRPGTWVLRPGHKRWRRLDPLANPPPRSGHALYYDAGTDAFVLFGGEFRGSARDDLWVFRLPPEEGCAADR
jgi:hypothetical protein